MTLKFPRPKREARAPNPLRRSAIKRGPVKRRRKSKRQRAVASLRKRCNDLWSAWIKRDGRCELLGHSVGMEIHRVCGGPLDAMHGLPKKVYPGVRYAEWNGVPGCRDVHAYFTWREPEWQNHLRSLWGNALYEERLRTAVMTKTNDLEAIVVSYAQLLGEVPK